MCRQEATKLPIEVEIGTRAPFSPAGTSDRDRAQTVTRQPLFREDELAQRGQPEAVDGAIVVDLDLALARQQ